LLKENNTNLRRSSCR